MRQPGDFSRRLVLQEPVETADGAGGVSRTWHDVAPLWAQVIPAAARGALVADSCGADVTHRILIRSGPEITTRHRLRDGARVAVADGAVGYARIAGALIAAAFGGANPPPAAEQSG